MGQNLYYVLLWRELCWLQISCIDYFSLCISNNLWSLMRKREMISVSCDSRRNRKLCGRRRRSMWTYNTNMRLQKKNTRWSITRVHVPQNNNYVLNIYNSYKRVNALIACVVEITVNDKCKGCYFCFCNEIIKIYYILTSVFHCSVTVSSSTASMIKGGWGSTVMIGVSLSLNLRAIGRVSLLRLVCLCTGLGEFVFVSIGVLTE